MPGKVAMEPMVEPIAWLKAADYARVEYRGYHEQQMALKAHLDSLSVELSLLRSDVVDVLHQRQLRRRRDDIFRLWHFQVAFDKLKRSQVVASRSPSPSRRGRTHRPDQDLRNENTLRCATLVCTLCFFLSSSLLQQIISNWRLAVHRLRKPLDLSAFPAWRLQLFLWAWRSAVEVKGSATWRMSLRQRLDEETQRFQPRLRSPMVVPHDVVQFLHLKAANALRTLRDNDLAYAILQAWNGAVVSATLAQIGGAAVYQPAVGSNARPCRGWTGRLAGQSLPARPLVFRRSSITMVHVLQAWQDACLFSRQGRQHIKTAAARICRETLRLVWHSWYHLGRAEKAQRMLSKFQISSLQVLSSKTSRHFLHLVWKTWMVASKFARASSRRDDQLRRLGVEASEALRSVWRCGQALVLFRCWHWLTVASAFELQKHRLLEDLTDALGKNRVLEGAHAAKTNDAKRYGTAMIFGRWRDWIRVWHLKRHIAEAEVKKLMQEIWLLWVCYIHDSRQHKDHDSRYDKQLGKLKKVSAKAAVSLYLLSKCSSCSAVFHAWALLFAQQRRETLRSALKERYFEGQVMAFWCGRGVRESLGQAWLSWCFHLRKRQLMNRICQVIYVRVLEENLRILRRCCNVWYVLMSKRRHGCDFLQLRRLRGRSNLQSTAFQCWLHSCAVALQEHLGTQTKVRSEQLLQFFAMRRSKRLELRCVFLAWHHHLRAAHRVDVTLGLAQSEAEWLSHACYNAWRVATMLGARQNHEARLQQRRQWAESAREDRYLMRHCISGWRTEILQLRNHQVTHLKTRLSTQLLHVRKLLQRKSSKSPCPLAAIVACWRNEAIVRSRTEATDTLLLSTCIRGWISVWNNRQNLATTKMLLALEKLSSRLLREKSLQICKTAYHAWWQARMSADMKRATAQRLLRVRGVSLLRLFWSRWVAAILMKRQRRLQHFKFQMQTKASQDLSLTRALTFYHWRGAVSSPAPRVYAYSLWVKCLGHRTLLDLAFRSWRSLPSQPRIESAGAIQAADEMLELCKCLETQNADLLLLLQERANANALMEVELQDSNPIES